MTVELAKTDQYWLDELAKDWKGEFPLRLHEGNIKSSYGLGSAPPFTREFELWIGRLSCKVVGCRECHNERNQGSAPKGRFNDHRTRATKAFRKLRKVAPREFDVLYMACVLGYTWEDVQRRLNERRHKFYSMDEVGILAASGIDKVKTWY